MMLEKWTGPPVETHTYLVADAPGGEAWVIDAPLDTAAPALDFARSHQLRLRRLVLTHAHFDHLLDAGSYAAAGIPIAANALDRPLLAAPQTALFGIPCDMPRVDIDEELEEGHRLLLGTQEWQVWHVPGHSPGHLLLYCPEREVVLGGDLLFQGGFGRIDLPGADPAAMKASLERLLTLPARTRIYPGHGPDFLLGEERSWLKPLLWEGRLR